MRLFLTIILLAGCAFAEVAPDSITITNTRGEAVTNLHRTVWAGLPLTINGVADQTLSNVALVVYIGTPGYFATVTNTPATATNAWSVTVTVPRGASADPGLVQVKLVDTSTNAYIYPHKQITIKEPL